MSTSRIVKFKDKSGKWHAFIAHFIDGFMIEEDVEYIEKITNGISD